jgi:hypothetical protein
MMKDEGGKGTLGTWLNHDKGSPSLLGCLIGYDRQIKVKGEKLKMKRLTAD